MGKAGNYKLALDRIERLVAKYLKTKGFVKKGRTYNRLGEDGLIQVINFQSGTFPIGKYEVSGFRESKYGQFTINLGIAVPEIYQVTYPQFPVPVFWKEYECQIRQRLDWILYNKHKWWIISDDAEHLSSVIIEGLEGKGMDWLGQYNTSKKICKTYKSSDNPRADLDVAIITYLLDPIKGTALFRKYYNKNHVNIHHNEHVREVAERLGVSLG